MNQVPIKFEFEGRTYNGEFSMPNGMGSIGNHWSLMINHYYYGTFHYSEGMQQWYFDSPSRQFKGMGPFFEFYMVSWFGAMV
jgi:hypothetical protein